MTPRVDVDELGRLLAETESIRRSLPGELHGGPDASYSEVFIEEAFAHHAPGDTHDTDLRQIWAADAALIAALVNAAPALLAEVSELRATVARVEANDEPCTCGYGGFHEELNSRCDRNRALAALTTTTEEQA